MDQYQYADCSKTSVKVHHQPGGASQWSIGWAGEDSGVSNQQKFQNQRKPPMQQQPRQSNQEHYQQAQGYTSQQQSRPPMAPPSHNYDYQKPQRAQMSQQPQQVYATRADSGERTSVKVHAPPGGKTSINIFGGYDAGEHNVSPSRLRPKPRDVQYKIGSQYQVAQDPRPANNFGPISLNQPNQAVQWQQQQNQRSAVKIQNHEEQPSAAVFWPSKADEPDRLNRGGYRQPSPQRMAGQNLVSQGYVPSQYTNNNQNIGGVRKSQQNYGYEQVSAVPVRYQQQQSDLNFGGLKQTQPPGGRSQIVLN